MLWFKLQTIAHKRRILQNGDFVLEVRLSETCTPIDQVCLDDPIGHRSWDCAVLLACSELILLG